MVESMAQKLLVASAGVPQLHSKAEETPVDSCCPDGWPSMILAEEPCSDDFGAYIDSPYFIDVDEKLTNEARSRDKTGRLSYTEAVTSKEGRPAHQ